MKKVYQQFNTKIAPIIAIIAIIISLIFLSNYSYKYVKHHILTQPSTTITKQHESQLIKQINDLPSDNQFTIIQVYHDNCGSCIKARRTTHQFLSENSQQPIQFLQIQDTTTIGSKLLAQYGTKYVPLLIVVNNKTHETTAINDGSKSTVQHLLYSTVH